jgi:ABC-type sugar transport system substrate-binding protein
MLSPQEAGSASGAALGAEGAAVLVVGEDAGAVGAAVAALRAAGVRAAGFIGSASASSAAVAEMAAELFPGLELLA